MNFQPGDKVKVVGEGLYADSQFSNSYALEGEIPMKGKVYCVERTGKGEEPTITLVGIRLISRHTGEEFGWMVHQFALLSRQTNHAQ